MFRETIVASAAAAVVSLGVMALSSTQASAYDGDYGRYCYYHRYDPDCSGTEITTRTITSITIITIITIMTTIMTTITTMSMSTMIMTMTTMIMTTITIMITTTIDHVPGRKSSERANDKARELGWIV